MKRYDYNTTDIKELSIITLNSNNNNHFSIHKGQDYELYKIEVTTDRV